jgi:hypothetical protein
LVFFPWRKELRRFCGTNGAAESSAFQIGARIEFSAASEGIGAAG